MLSLQFAYPEAFKDQTGWDASRRRGGVPLWPILYRLIRHECKVSGPMRAGACVRVCARVGAHGGGTWTSES